MFENRRILRGLAAAGAAALLAAGCADSGYDLDINAPILQAAGINIKEGLLGKPAPEPDLPQHAPLVMPPPNAELPVPGSRPQPAVAANFPVDPVDAKKQKAQEAAAKKKAYCENGKWNGKSTIEDFQKNVGLEPRCRPDWVSKVTGNVTGKQDADKQ